MADPEQPVTEAIVSMETLTPAIQGRRRRRMEWITCKKCGERALVRVGGKGYCSRGSCRGSGGKRVKGADHFAWKGEGASYSALHYRVRRLRGSPDRCTQCGRSEPGIRYEWASLTGNLADPYDYASMCRPCHTAYDLELRSRGERHHAAKLTEDIVRECRVRRTLGESLAELASEFGVHPSSIENAIKGKTWKHVE